jgi:hypothetical protein
MMFVQYSNKAVLNLFVILCIDKGASSSSFNDVEHYIIIRKLINLFLDGGLFNTNFHKIFIF